MTGPGHPGGSSLMHSVSHLHVHSPSSAMLGWWSPWRRACASSSEQAGAIWTRW